MNIVNEESSSIQQKSLSEASFFDFSKIVVNGKKTIFIYAIIFGFLFTIYAHIKPDLYKAEALLKVVESEDSPTSSSLSSSFGDIASLGGINVGGGSSQAKANLAIAVIKSRAFLENIINIDNNHAKIIAVDFYDKASDQIIYDENLYIHDKKLWVREKSFFDKIFNIEKTNKPTLIETHNIYIDEIINIEQDKKTGFLHISVKHQSPKFASNFLSLIIDEANNSIREKDLKDSSNSLNYLTRKISETNILDIKKSVSTLIEAQLEKQMRSYIKNDYILEKIDPPIVPSIKSGPNRFFITISGFILGVVFSIFILFLRNLYTIKG